MRRRKLLLAGVSLAAHALSPLEVAHADRRSGLGGNVLIQDPDDLFPFPQYTLQHRNMIRLDYGGAAASGNGVLTLGDEDEAVGLALHRGDLLSPDVVGFNTELAWVAGVGSPFGSSSFSTFAGPDVDLPATGEFVLPATVVDLSYARAIGRDALGVRLGFGRGVRAVKDADAETVSKGAQTFFAAQLGYSSLPETGFRYDTSASVVFAFGKAMTDDVDDNSGWDLRIGGLGRAYYPINELVDVGFLGNLTLQNEHTEADAAGSDSNDFAFGLMGGVGPAIHLERAKIAAYGGLRMDVNKNEPNSTVETDESNRLRLLAPLFNMAVEVQVLDWLYVRTGAEYVWLLDRLGTDAEKQRATDGGFAWSAGLGLQRGSFFFDGVVRNAFVTGGPNFIGGNADGFLVMASLTYKFGDVFGSRVRPEEAPPAAVQPIERPAAPALPPTPPPEPAAAAPDQELEAPVVEAAGERPAPSLRTNTSAKGRLSVGR